jgi:hypothetical protein
MSPLIPYLLKMTLVSGVLYLYYHAALRDNRFHQWNRFYLLAAVLLSIALPLIHIPVHRQEQVDDKLLMAVYRLLDQGNVPTPAIAVHVSKWAAITWGDLLTAGYEVVSVSLLGLLFLRLRRIQQLHRRSPHIRLEKIVLVETREQNTPFSFFRWIFWNQAVDIHSPEGKHILRHELTHVRQGHSLDKIGMELACILFFPVPFFYMIRRELQIIHEYMADKQATRDEDLVAYAQLLVSQAFDAHPYAFANSFWHHPLKRRIAMMTRFSNPRFSYLRKVMFLPLALGLFGLLAFRIDAAHPGLVIRLEKAAQQVTQVHLTAMSAVPLQFELQRLPLFKTLHLDTTPVLLEGAKPLVFIDGVEVPDFNAVSPDRIESISVYKGDSAVSRFGAKAVTGVICIRMKDKADTTPALSSVRINGYGAISSDPSDPDNKVFTKSEVEAAFPGGDSAWHTYVQKVITEHADELTADKRSGTCVIQFIVNRDGTISGIAPLTMQDSRLAALCMKVLLDGPKWIPAMQNGHNVRAFSRKEISFELPN